MSYSSFVLDKDVQKVLRSMTSGKKLNFPYKSSSSSPYRIELEARLNEFLRRITKLDSNKSEFAATIRERFNDLVTLRDSILLVIDHYLVGDIGSAYDEVERLLKSTLINTYYPKLTFDLGKNPKSPKSLFRIRVSSSQLSDQYDIFHVPFELRHLVSSQRYSISGLPSLYLGESIYVCWEEMGRPDLNQVYLSRFEAKSHNGHGLKYLNLAYSLELLLKEELELPLEDELVDRQLFEAFIFMYPIVIACSFKRAHEKAHFNVEYVLPNLILRAIHNNVGHFNGLAYLSTKSKHVRNFKYGVNYVFPPQSDSAHLNGVCPTLAELFKCTRPISWQLLDAIAQEQPNDSIKIEGSSDFEEEILKNYTCTRFHRFEQILNKVEVTQVNAKR